MDKLENRVETYLLTLSEKELSESESREISELLHTCGEFERVFSSIPANGINRKVATTLKIVWKFAMPPLSRKREPRNLRAAAHLR